MNKYLNKLKLKCNLNDEFISIIIELVDKLVSFGYISKFNLNNIYKILFNNIDVVILNNNKLDYKSGYYDSIKKELYIKDITNIKSIYLRLIYILTTKQISKDSYEVGYSKAILSNTSYKIEHSNFGINRAIVSNLVCRLMNTIPTTLSIVPSYRTYENDFLGYKINSDNDLYFLEGKILSELCFTCDINEEILYINLFKKNKHINKIFNKVINTDFFNLLDKISRIYSNYNKLCYFDKLLNETYFNLKKNKLNSDIKELEFNISTIKKAISNTLNKLNKNDDFELENSLREKLSNFEESIVNNIYSLQNILIEILILKKNKFHTLEYVIKLNKLENMLILKNNNLTNELYKVITNDIIHMDESSFTNIHQKIKFSLIDYVLSSERYSKIYDYLTFNLINNFGNNLIESYSLVKSDGFFAIAYTTNLNQDLENMNNTTKFLSLDNLNYLFNKLNSDIDKIEIIFTNIKNIHNNIKLDNVYMCKTDDSTLIITNIKNNFNVLKLNDDLSLLPLTLSEDFYIIGQNKNLPVKL